jgi:anaerobic selenocysteine-containing dehydrogenase
MGKKITRRRMLQFVGGSAAGVLLTPIPWKTLDDLAIWTQNNSWIPKPLRGEIRTRFTACTLCSAGCAVRARCVGSQPVSLSGVANHPVSPGGLCPAGLGGHHLPYHPARLLQPARLDRENTGAEPVPLSVDAAVSSITRLAIEIRKGGSARSIAVLDPMPGRTLSRIYRKFLGSLGDGVYLTAAAEKSGFDALQHMMADPWGQAGLDLENTATLLSFGAPVLDGWGTPGRVRRAANQRNSNGSRRLKIIQVESRRSRTASAADLWLPIQPGTESALALGLAHILIREDLIDAQSTRDRATDFEGTEGASYRSLVQKFTPERISATTGLSAETIASLARELAARAPALVIGGGDPGGGPLGEEEERAIAGLNLLLGSVGRPGGIVAHRDVPEDPALSDPGLAAVSRLEDIPDGSIGLLIVDSARSGSALPWNLIGKKITPKNGVIVALSPVLAGDARRAHMVIPTAAYLETLAEAPGPIDSPASTFRLSPALQSVPTGVVDPAQLIHRLATALSLPSHAGGEDGSLSESLKRKAEAIHKSGRGSVFVPQEDKQIELRSLDGPDKFWKILAEGGCWIDAPLESQSPSRYTLLGNAKNGYQTLAAAGEGRLHPIRDQAVSYPLVLLPFGLRAALDDGQVSPLLTKLYQESGLRRLRNQADINPATAKAFGLSDRTGAVVETTSGRIKVEIRFDPGVMPGVIQVAIGPSGPVKGQGVLRDRQSVLTICQTESGSVWRVARAKVREA